MSRRRHRASGDSGRESRDFSVEMDGDWSSGGVFGGFLALSLVGVFCVSGPFSGYHAWMLGGVGLLMVWCPPRFALPRSWWWLALGFMLAGCAAFLPVDWFGIPEWRRELEVLGLETGSRVVIQQWIAAEGLLIFWITLLGGFWLCGHRGSPLQIRFWALAFVVGVACYAVVSRVVIEVPDLHRMTGGGNYGFFPNRNHTATLLAMGAVCGLGCALQAMRDKRFVVLVVALCASAVCLWAIAAWSISRAGVALAAAGVLIWIFMLGRRYLGRHGLWAVGLVVVAAVGLFLVTGTQVRERVGTTVERTGSVLLDGRQREQDPEALRSALDSGIFLDFRIPAFLDTLQLIRSHPWTGVGARQYIHVMPQYRDLTIVANDSYLVHPESDWLWMAAEIGIPGTVALSILVALAAWKSYRGIRRGRDRAIRASCLAAALLLPLHGLFDVPGHRIALAWCAVFLYVLSLHPPGDDQDEAPKLQQTGFAVIGMLLLLGSGLLARAQWFGGMPPPSQQPRVAVERANELYRQDRALERAATAAGREHRPPADEDKLLEAIRILEAARARAPMDRDLILHEARTALYFDHEHDRVDHLFALKRGLNPIRVRHVLIQAEAWSGRDPERTGALWREAMERAKRVDQLDPDNMWSSLRTMERIERMAAGQPELEDQIPGR